MDNIQSLALEIAHATIAQSWPFYALVILLTLLSSAAGAFFSSYFSKRAEHRAIQADFELLKSQLSETTRITESIRTELNHALNRRHAIETIKREKLEAYVQKICEAAENLTHEMHEKIFGSKLQYDLSAFSTASMIQSMYLPEIDEAHAAFALACVDFRNWLVEGMQVALDNRAQGQPYARQSEEYLARYSEHLSAVLATVSAIELKAKEVGRSLIQVGHE